MAPTVTSSSDAAARLGAQAWQDLLELPGPWPSPEIAAVLLRAALADPARARSVLDDLYERQWALWEAVRSTDPGAPNSDAANHPWFRHLRAQYTSWRDWLLCLPERLAVPAADRAAVVFALTQWADAADPDNALATNPEALARAFATRGDSVARGLANLARDTQQRRSAHSPASGLAPGLDIALTPGAVVNRNAVSELIHYRPAGAQVHRIPLLVIPPFINKYYILDLRPDTSFVRFAVMQGFDVFLVSWADPDAASSWTWDDYVRLGIDESVARVARVTGVDRVHLLGYCIGGTLAATALARGGKHAAAAASLSLLATLLDFSEPGDVGFYLREDIVAGLEAEYGDRGVIDGRRLGDVFASLRARELVWPAVQRAYLLGDTPPANDLLGWNADAIGLPGPLFTWYLRRFYLDNTLMLAGAVQVCGQGLDIRAIDAPVYALATERDHIVLWRSAFASLAPLAGPVRFVLASGGHVSGVVNPPGSSRGRFRTGNEPGLPAADWRNGARCQAGSWWTDWAAWLAERSEGFRLVSPTRRPRTVLGAAPGRYVFGGSLGTGRPHSFSH